MKKVFVFPFISLIFFSCASFYIKPESPCYLEFSDSLESFVFENNYGLQVKGFDLVVNFFDFDGESVFDEGEVVLKYCFPVMPFCKKDFEIDLSELSQYMVNSEVELSELNLDYAYVRTIYYEDGTLFEDYFGSCW